MQSLDRHNASKMHEIRSSTTNIKKYTCACGKFYLHQQSLRNHKMKCTFIEAVIPTRMVDVKQDIIDNQKELQKVQADLTRAFDKERQEMKLAFEKELNETKLALRETKLTLKETKLAFKETKIAFKESMKEQIDTFLLEKHADSSSNNMTNNETEPPQPHQKSRNKRKCISKVVRQRVVETQENACGECKQTLTLYYEMDHIIALQFGGTDEETNLMALCRECHAKKSITENQRRIRIQDAIQTILRET